MSNKVFKTKPSSDFYKLNMGAKRKVSPKTTKCWMQRPELCGSCTSSKVVVAAESAVLVARSCLSYGLYFYTLYYAFIRLVA